jgi:hypothetical protein
MFVYYVAAVPIYGCIAKISLNKLKTPANEFIFKARGKPLSTDIF